jgi:hypothetical protein
LITQKAWGERHEMAIKTRVREKRAIKTRGKYW